MKYLLTTLITIAAASLFSCQKELKEIIVREPIYEYVLNKKGVTYEKILFKDAYDNSIVKEIVFSDINPFNHLNFPVDRVDNHGNKIYDLSKINNNKIQQKLGHISLHEKAVGQEFYSASSQFTGTDKRTKDHVALAFKFNLFNKDGLITQLTKIFVFNAKGETVASILNNDIGCNNLALTNNGKYMVCHFGGMHGCGTNDKFVEGFRFFDVKNQKILFDQIINSGRFGRPYAKDDLIVISENKGNGIEEFHIYDFSRNMKYSKLFKRSLNINEIDEMGVYGIDENDNTGRYNFDTDFVQTMIN